MKSLLLNNKGNGYVPGKRDLLKILGVLITAPISIPVLILIDKIKKKKEAKK